MAISPKCFHPANCPRTPGAIQPGCCAQGSSPSSGEKGQVVGRGSGLGRGKGGRNILHLNTSPRTGSSSQGEANGPSRQRRARATFHSMLGEHFVLRLFPKQINFLFIQAWVAVDGGGEAGHHSPAGQDGRFPSAPAHAHLGLSLTPSVPAQSVSSKELSA